MITSDTDASLKWCSTPPLWHSMPSGGVHPIISVRFEGAKPALTGKADMLLRPLVYRLMTQRGSGSKNNFDAMVVHRIYSFMDHLLQPVVVKRLSLPRLKNACPETTFRRSSTRRFEAGCRWLLLCSSAEIEIPPAFMEPKRLTCVFSTLSPTLTGAGIGLVWKP